MTSCEYIVCGSRVLKFQSLSRNKATIRMFRLEFYMATLSTLLTRFGEFIAVFRQLLGKLVEIYVDLNQHYPHQNHTINRLRPRPTCVLHMYEIVFSAGTSFCLFAGRLWISLSCGESGFNLETFGVKSVFVN